jgi:hypothetical protein
MQVPVVDKEYKPTSVVLVYKPPAISPPSSPPSSPKHTPKPAKPSGGGGAWGALRALAATPAKKKATAASSPRGGAGGARVGETRPVAAATPKPAAKAGGVFGRLAKKLKSRK